MRARDVSPIAAVDASMVVAWYEAAMALPSYRRTLAQMLELVKTAGTFYSARHSVLCAGLMGALSDGDLETSASWLQELERDVHRLGPMFRFWHHWFIVWDALIRRDVARAATISPRCCGWLSWKGVVPWTRRSPICSRPRCCTRGAWREMREDISTVDSRSGAT
jgi:hypothetical protein